MINLELICTGKNSRIEGDSVVNDITFAPNTHPYNSYAAGAAIGVPDVDKGLPEVDKVSYNLVSGAFTIKVLDAKEADKYSVGETYTLGIGALKSK